MPKAQPISVQEMLDSVRFLPDRTPHTTDKEAAPAFATLSDYRDGGLFVGHFAGNSEWERHSQGDEIVYVLDGTTRLFLWVEGEEQGHDLKAGELMVVPQNIWHRFEAPDGVKIMAVTPQPTDHRVDRPE
ncbi:cupin domain-containing protein [Saccharospirillum salsuginis]|uniref:Cupin type-2 domain-containing protein n=1 Tax=Saccharospirillum salsuginis TaxID=418750 RepID=A0A918K708_9GAMM|nr:cupin domain-containing protein [Saccharospirillum salsuginis]GGX48884.1 hypothetical protein GCM10007392_15110 [Saccharospirillum salsuginis]